MSTLTSLQAARTAVLAYLESGKWTKQSVRVGSTEFEYMDLASAVKALRELDALIEVEGGTSDWNPRSFVQNAGTGTHYDFGDGE